VKNFLIIWIGELISSIGSGMTAFAVAVYVYQLTGNATMVSVAALLAYLPTILLSPVGTKELSMLLFKNCYFLITKGFLSSFKTPPPRLYQRGASPYQETFATPNFPSTADNK
jgi:hypothetical protein